MDIKQFIERVTIKEITDKLVELVESNESSIPLLQQFLLYRYDDTFGKHFIPRLVCRALLQKGPAGVRALAIILPKAPGSIYPTAIFESLWYASKGQLVHKCIPEELSSIPPLSQALSQDTINEARSVVHELIVESKFQEGLFSSILQFLYQENLVKGFDSETGMSFRNEIFDIFTEGNIKISQRLIREFEELIQQDHSEEIYQTFLKEYPVFLDPLASEIIPKQKLGLELVTDFVIRRHDNKYILVEIEKPQAVLFTASNDFSARLTHGFGQILDFQQWIETHGEYARTLMPGIFSPRGLLVIGRRDILSQENSKKLHRFSVNSSAIEIVTFDDLVVRAKNLYKSIYQKEANESVEKEGRQVGDIVKYFK